LEVVMPVLDLTEAEQRASVVSHLRVAAQTVEEMRARAESQQSSDVIPLGEASQAIHRALIVLKADGLQVSRPEAFTVEW
jgi:hypothetical protein